MSWEDVLIGFRDLIPPVLTGVGGAAAAIWRMGVAYAERISKLEEKITFLGSRVTTIEASIKKSEEKVSALIPDITLTKEKIQSQLRESVSNERHLALHERVANLEKHLDELSKESSNNSDALTRFIKDQSNQGQHIKIGREIGRAHD